MSKHHVSLAALFAICTACGPDEGSIEGRPNAGFETSTVVATTTSQEPNCGVGAGAQVVIGMYGDADCTPGTEGMILTVDTSTECFGWTRSTSKGTRDNSASRFQCFRDRLCYTQYTRALACDTDSPNDKVVKTDECRPEPQGHLWTKILSGTESCPEAPEGFECPLSTSEGSGSRELGFACTP